MTVQRNTLENRTLPGNRNTPTTISSVIGNQMAKRLARVTFIQRQRLQICIEYFNEPKKNQEYMRHWAKREFSLSQLSLQSTISKIVSKHEKLAQMPDKDLDSSSSKEAKYPCLEEKIIELVDTMEAENIAINKHTIRASIIHAMSTNPDLVGNGQALCLSNGWLNRFMKRHDLCSRQMNGEAGSVQINTAAVQDQTGGLKELMKQYQLKDIFNFDRAAPTKTISSQGVSDIKFDKTRLTIGLLCNADG